MVDFGSHGVMLALLLVFAVVHSGLAAWRSRGEQLIGARAYRVIFALASLPLAAVLLIYFFNHRYDGIQLWQLQGVPGVKALVAVLSVISFLFLYPATFNLLEVAAIAKPQVHLYEAGIMRITRHPQMVGQVIWCIAHTLWIGSSFVVAASLGLIGHHLFAVWHGDRRWLTRHGDAFTALKERTSVVPFLAIAQGKQTLVWHEFFRPAYLGVLVAVGIFAALHPWAIATFAELNW
ncbi:MAG: NnrU family protein [Pseudanabaenaceae cyanobacterium bins.68]|nr:NnrU family protein [Pseudanabaenaceae cyanobacterium bins.68]